MVERKSWFDINIIENVKCVGVYVRYYHLARPRRLNQLFTSGRDNENECGHDNGISDIEYTVDIRSGARNNNHRCSAFQDSYSVS